MTVRNGSLSAVRFAAAGIFTLGCALGQGPGLPAGAPLSLDTVPVREPATLGQYVRNRDLARVLGKALFWDMQAGSDGVTACATCHFHAGADHRLKNQTHPGTAGFHEAGPNGALALGQFPFRQLANPGNRNSAVLRDNNDIAGSQGVLRLRFLDVQPGADAEAGIPDPDLQFSVGGVGVRQVTGRNTPTVVNAVFHFRTFWDGRADFLFNGRNHLGAASPDLGLYAVGPEGRLEKVDALLDFSSLASQAVAPPMSSVEMSYSGRGFADLGRKLLALRPLAKQMVHPEDSLLGPFARSGTEPSQPGLAFATYREMVEAAFQPRWWDSTETIERNGRRYTLIEDNFSLFFGLAVQMYESLLVSDDAPYDRFRRGDASALTAAQRAGLNTFLGGGRCIQCHAGPEFAGAASTTLPPNGQFITTDLIRTRSGAAALADKGFFNIGVRPTEEDLGLAAGHSVAAVEAADRQLTAIRGAFKAPSLRNVELTGPYFHTGGVAVLEDVIRFYQRGGDFANPEQSNDVRGFGGGGNTVVNLTEFLKSLTDDRVRYERAPFDHPQLCVPDGHPGDAARVAVGAGGQAADALVEIPAAGARGHDAPLQTFDELLRGVNGNRAHAAPRPCPVSTR